MPSADRLEKIATTLGTTPAWLLGKNGAEERSDEDVTPEARLVSLRSLPRNLPIFGTALAADLELSTVDGDIIAVEQTEVNMAAPQDFMSRPTSIAGRKEMYVVIVAGHSMEPRYDAGRRLLIDGRRTAMIGDDVVVQLKRPIGDDGDVEVSAVLIKRLVRKRASGILLQQFNPETTFELPTSRIHSVHPVLPWDDALGF